MNFLMVLRKKLFGHPTPDGICLEKEVMTNKLAFAFSKREMFVNEENYIAVAGVMQRTENGGELFRFSNYKEAAAIIKERLFTSATPIIIFGVSPRDRAMAAIICTALAVENFHLTLHAARELLSEPDLLNVNVVDRIQCSAADVLTAMKPLLFDDLNNIVVNGLIRVSHDLFLSRKTGEELINQASSVRAVAVVTSCQEIAGMQLLRGQIVLIDDSPVLPSRHALYQILNQLDDLSGVKILHVSSSSSVAVVLGAFLMRSHRFTAIQAAVFVNLQLGDIMSNMQVVWLDENYQPL